MENGPEIFIENPEEKTDAGFSEKRAARVLEGKQQDNSQVKKRKPLVLSPKQKIVSRAARVGMSNREKLLVAYHTNSEDIHTLLESLHSVSQGAWRQSEQLHAEIHGKQKLQEEVMHAIILDSKGELQIDTLSKELADLIK